MASKKAARKVNTDEFAQDTAREQRVSEFPKGEFHITSLVRNEDGSLYLTYEIGQAKTDGLWARWSVEYRAQGRKPYCNRYSHADRVIAALLAHAQANGMTKLAQDLEALTGPTVDKADW